MESFRFQKSKENSQEIIIPESELVFTTSRSGGAGGQNVNKVETKVTVRWDFAHSPTLTEQEKQQIENDPVLKNRINDAGELVIYSQTERTQAMNKKKAKEILHHLVHAALNPPSPRTQTKIPKRERQKRREEKRFQSEKKQLRKKIDF